MFQEMGVTSPTKSTTCIVPIATPPMTGVWVDLGEVIRVPGRQVLQEVGHRHDGPERV